MTALALDTGARPAEERPAWRRRLHLLLTAQSALLVLASINRLSSATDARLLPHGSLRVVDVVNLLVLVPATVMVLYLLLEHVLADASARARRALRIGFVASLYLYAVSYGMHEPADFLHAHFCHGDEQGSLCQVVGYQDDGLSHGLFFVGFAGIDAVLLFAQAAAAGASARFTGRDRTLLLANASVVAAAIVANLGFEAIGLDLFVVAAVAGLALFLLRRRGPLPLITYFTWAYGIGLVATVLVRAL